MKKILKIIEQYLRTHPTPTQITSYKSMLGLTYSYSSSYTDSKNTKNLFQPIGQISQESPPLEPEIAKITYNEKGKIQESNSFEGILAKDKHQKIVQDDVFGSAVQSKNLNRWVYIAEVKQEVAKSYFLDGKGKLPYKADFGQLYDEVKEVGIFIWDKELKKVLRVEIDKDIIPSFPSFSNEEGTQIIFHAYKRESFGYGILHCFNRRVKVYSCKLVIKIDKSPPGKEQTKLQASTTQLFSDHHQTNIFPAISPCFQYIVYLSGTGITHTYYLDLVVLKKIDGEDKIQWVQKYRIKQQFVGYYDTLKSYIIVENGIPYAISTTLHKNISNILKVNLQTGSYINIVQKYPDHTFSISDVLPSGTILGKVSTANYNSFFYAKQNKINIIKPLHSQNFTIKQILEPIHCQYIQAEVQDILEEYKQRASNRPLFVLVHGGPHGSFVNSLTLLRYVLLKMGYAILMPNFSGSAGYGKGRLENALGKIGEIDAKEIISVIEHVIREFPVDKSRVHVYGGSYGGYMSAILGSRYPQYFKSAVILNGVLSIIANLWSTDIPQWNIVQTLKKDKLGGLTEHDYIEMYKQSPSSEPMKIPTLQFLGGKDRRVPFKQGLMFDAITKDYGTPITTYVYENSGHALADSVDTVVDIAVKSILFLEGIKEEQKSEDKQKKTEEKEAENN